MKDIQGPTAATGLGDDLGPTIAGHRDGPLPSGAAVFAAEALELGLSRG